jgi:hypothetical protein
MVANPPVIYPHRRNKNGSYDSICLRCFATVAHTNTEIELLAHESIHACDQAFLTMFRFFRPTAYRHRLRD